MSFFDDIMTEGVLPMQQWLFGETLISYLSKTGNVEDVSVVWGNPQTAYETTQRGEQAIERVVCHIPRAAVTVLDPDAIIQKGSDLWAVESIYDDSPTYATFHLVRTLHHGHNVRRGDGA